MVLGIAALSGLIPKIEGFAPLPSAAADAFMSMQGGHMALYFGAMYKFGTRFVDSLDNETYNSYKLKPALLIAALKPMNDAITDAFMTRLNTDIDPIQNRVLDKAYDLEILKIHQNVKLLKELPSAYWEAIWSTNQKINQAIPAGENTSSTTDFAPTGYHWEGTNLVKDPAKSVQLDLSDTVSISDTSTQPDTTGTTTQKDLSGTVIFFGETLTKAQAFQRIKTLDTQVQEGSKKLLEYASRLIELQINTTEYNRILLLQAELRNLTISRVKSLSTMRTTYFEAYGEWA